MSVPEGLPAGSAAQPAADAPTPQIPVLAVVGVGLIGGSFAAALRAAGSVRRIIGVGRNPASLAQAQQLGLIDEIADAADAAARADLVFLSTPVGAMSAVLRTMAPHLRATAVVTDGGSTKQDVIAAARQGLGERIGQFVPGHPIAGSERTGPEAASADLYRGRHVVLTPLTENTPARVGFVEAAWTACGARVSAMPADEHDQILASVSHLPHLLAAAHVAQIDASGDGARRLSYAGSGFRDFSRIAAGSAEMWRDIFLANRDALLAELQAVQATLDTVAGLIRDDQGDALEAFLARAAQVRGGWRHE